MKRPIRLFSVIGVLLLLLSSLPIITHALTASNATYVVDRLTDNDPFGGGQGTGLTGDLRYTLTHAQSGDRITFSVIGTIYLSGSLSSLTRDITIEGPGANKMTVRGAGGNVISIGNGTTVTISGITFTRGVGNGGGIFNAGILTLNHCTISGNTAGDPTNGGGTGAGIWNYTSGILTLNNSTVNGNSVYGNSSYNPSRGGGIANYGTLTINNSTISGNSTSEGSGGGISNTLPGSKLTVKNSTISGNSATGVISTGGGIDNHGSFQSSNSIIAGNTNNLAPDLSGSVSSLGHNLIGNTTGGSGFQLGMGDLLNVNPQLGPLQYNGGPTKTMALLPGSLAIDKGNDATCLSTDQRGVQRPQGAHCDIGAFEFGSTTIIPGIEVKIRNVIEDVFPLAPTTSARQSYVNVNGGPVRVEHTDNKLILTSQRVIYTGKSYSEMIGLPLEQLSHEYWFPNYNNVAMNSQLRISNVGNVSTAVKVYLGSQQIDGYNLAPGTGIRKNYLGKNGGPLRITSSASNIMSTVRVLYGNSSYSEMIGLPVEQLSHEYWFPYYNNVAMDSQLRISNAGNVPTTIIVYLGPQQIDSYQLAAGTATRKNYAGKNGGPLHVTSSATNILSTIRVLYHNNSYSELMGVPADRITNKYWYPIYDNSFLNSQLRVSNVGAGPTTVTIYAGNTLIDSYTLAKGASSRKNYSQNTGPLSVTSSAEPVLTSIRLLYKTATFTSFYEIIGLPDTEISTQYFFPWYNNIALASELRFARP